MKPFGGLITPMKTAENSILLKLGESGEMKRTEKHGYNVHLGTEFIYKKVNETIIVNRVRKKTIVFLEHSIIFFLIFTKLLKITEF